jgi:hypothetical protein
LRPVRHPVARGAVVALYDLIVSFVVSLPPGEARLRRPLSASLDG